MEKKTRKYDMYLEIWCSEENGYGHITLSPRYAASEEEPEAGDYSNFHTYGDYAHMAEEYGGFWNGFQIACQYTLRQYGMAANERERDPYAYSFGYNGYMHSGGFGWEWGSIEKAEAMYKTLKKVTRKYEKSFDALGVPNSFEEFALRVAAAMGAKGFIVRNKTDKVYNKLNARDASWVIRKLYTKGVNA